MYLRTWMDGRTLVRFERGRSLKFEQTIENFQNGWKPDKNKHMQIDDYSGWNYLFRCAKMIMISERLQSTVHQQAKA